MSKQVQITNSDYPFITPDEESYYHKVRDQNCALRNYKNLLQIAIEDDKRKYRKRDEFKRKLHGPDWYEKLTERQVAASNMLFTALANDGIKCQYKRVQHVLIAIGIKPFPARNELIKAIEFSKSSDLAFLWFLYNSIYRSSDEFCSQKNYTYNERVILSCICHLDMLVTLRELDKILPPPKITTKLRSASNKPKYPNILPSKPVPPLEIYDMYKDPFYVIENESNRWFSRDYLIPTESYCIAQKIIHTEISKISQEKSEDMKKLLCSNHKHKLSRLNQLMLKLIKENEEKNFLEDKHKHLTITDRGMAYKMHVEFQKCENEFNENCRKLETEIIVKSILRQILENSIDRRYLHLCQKCEGISLPNNKNEMQICSENRLKFSSSYDPSIVKYFHRPSTDGSHPLTFDYEKIFSIDFLHDHNVVKNSINTALKINKYLTVDNAITACLRDMWRLELKVWNEKRQADMEDRQQRVVANCYEIGRDKEKIFKLLREAISIMRKNSKFVLAHLPNCHRLPILREWICLRYGVKYIDESLIKNKYGMDGRYR